MRIASLAPSVTSMLQELGVVNQLVACTTFCPLPPPLRQRLAVGSFSVLDVERVVAAAPDIVVTATLVQAGGSERLRAAGLPVLHLDPRSLADIADSYTTLGRAVGRGLQGEQQCQQLMAAVAAIPAPSGPWATVYMEEWHEPPYVAGNWVPELVERAGGRPILTAPGMPSRVVTVAEISAADPDLIVQHVCLPPGRDWTAHRARLRQQLLARPGWAALRAVQQGRVYSLDDGLYNMPTSVVLRGVAALRQVLGQYERVTA